MTDTLSPFFEIKRATPEGIFTGYASTFGPPPDFVGDIIAPGAFNTALAFHEKSNTKPALLWAHDLEQPIGKWLDFKADSHGLLATGQLTLGVKKAREALDLLRDNAVSLSIGFSLSPGGATHKAGIRTIHDIGRLHEISIVAIPANSKAKVTEVKTPRFFEQMLREKCDLSNREAKRFVAGGYQAFVRDGRLSESQLILDKVEELRNIIQSRMR